MKNFHIVKNFSHENALQHLLLPSVVNSSVEAEEHTPKETAFASRISNYSCFPLWGRQDYKSKFYKKIRDNRLIQPLFQFIVIKTQ